MIGYSRDEFSCTTARRRKYLHFLGRNIKEDKFSISRDRSLFIVEILKIEYYKKLQFSF